MSSLSVQVLLIVKAKHVGAPGATLCYLTTVQNTKHEQYMSSCRLCESLHSATTATHEPQH